MDIEALNTFLTLANTKNYTRTAAQLFSESARRAAVQAEVEETGGKLLTFPYGEGGPPQRRCVAQRMESGIAASGSYTIIYGRGAFRE